MTKPAHILLAFFAILSSAFCTALFAEPVPENIMKSTYLYHFAVYTEWDKNSTSPLNFCLLGRDNLGTALDNLANKEIKGKKIVVKRLADTENIEQCHLVYFSDSNQINAKQIVSAVGDWPILLVTDDTSNPGFMIYLSLTGQKLSFDIHYDTIKKHHISLSSKVMPLAKHIYY